MILGAALAGAACRDLVLDPDRVIAIEVSRTQASLAVGDTLRLAATALNAAGAPVAGAIVRWDVLDTGVVAFTLDTETGLVTGVAPGVGRVQASIGALRSDPLAITVTAPTPTPTPTPGFPGATL